jgi:DNA-binding transcriptional regulator PaaX
VRLSAGALYAVISRLESRGLIEPLKSEDRRRPYRLTTAGARELVEQTERMRSSLATVLMAWAVLAGLAAVCPTRCSNRARQRRAASAPTLAARPAGRTNREWASYEIKAQMCAILTLWHVSCVRAIECQTLVTHCKHDTAKT